MTKTPHPLPLLVQKFGGATLADSAKIKAAALRISEQAKTHRLIVTVSAMGQTTNQLINLANEVSQQPLRREMDMLLSVGERISMSLLSMALNDLGCPAISFTGSQAGILTDNSHVNAFIQDLKPIRVAEALDSGLVAIIAGFQGVSPLTKEITTLGRGGTDTTAVAMAAHFQAERCDILKDVPGVFTADPKIVKQAKPIYKLNYEALLEMTFWGAKVLHYRSVELAKNKKVKIYVGPASQKLSDGTLITEGQNMFESIKALSLNSHESVIKIFSKHSSTAEALQKLQAECTKFQIAFPQILSTQTDSQIEFLMTGPIETISAIEKSFKEHKEFKVEPHMFSTVTLTCSGSTSPEISQSILSTLEKAQIKPQRLMMSAMSASLLINQNERIKALQALHELI